MTTEAAAQLQASLDTGSATVSSTFTKTLWDDPEIKKTIELMDPATRYKYQQMGRLLYNQDYTGVPSRHSNNNNNNTDNDIESASFDAATQIDLMLRDGLSVSMLTEEERVVYENVFGINKLNEYIKNV